ncbi:MAG: pseudouridine synthase [Lachnospiraceae bacterium]|nr:pseudouridine synthase [Lachnospiraceae bacterium]
MSAQKEESVRINKYLALCGVCSRRDADKLVENGSVKINGITAQSGSKVFPGDVVTYGGKRLVAKDRVILLYNKPVGVTCTERDPHAIRKIVDEIKFAERITYAGRLDQDSEGLMILTNDGDLIQKMMKGSSVHEKEYIVKVDKEITEDFIRDMSAGMYLKELKSNTRPCVTEKLGKYTFRIILTQGLNRQIRRMCGELGYKVTSLRRIRILHLTIGDLPSGKWRYLTKEEEAGLLHDLQME